MTLSVDIYSDVVCPWCFVGKRRLEQALQKLGDRYETRIAWHPFELNPGIPREGIVRTAYRKAKFGSLAAAQALDARLTKVGATVGIPFAFDRIRRTPNTFDAHRLLWFAQRRELQDRLVEALFRGYFIEGADLGDRQLLVGIAGGSGLSGAEVERFLVGDEGAAAVREDEARAWRMGINGVPHFIINGEYAVPGAQNAEILASVFEEVMSRGATHAAVHGPAEDHA